MKLKELPISLLKAWQLIRLDSTLLREQQNQVIPLIISLTSIPSRLATIHLTIRSLLAQTYKPERIILWLNTKLRDSLPASLRRLEGAVFEIRFRDLECSHRKLIYALNEYPEKVIVTCDDDLMYEPTWLERLYTDHLRFPNDIIAHECRLIALDNNLCPQPYENWTVEKRAGFTDPWLMPIGYGGVLYPPHCLHPDVTHPDLFLTLTPKADDLWFKAMSYRLGTATRKSSHPGKKPIPIIGSQKTSLKHTNVRQDGNYLQWLAVCKHYNFFNHSQNGPNGADR